MRRPKYKACGRGRPGSAACYSLGSQRLRSKRGTSCRQAIGLGDPMVTSWGTILNAWQRVLNTAWWVAVEPGIMLFLTVLAFNFLGDGIRDAFDPRSQA